MKVFLLLFRRILKKRLSIKERKELLKILKAKRNKYKIERDGL